LVVNGSLNQGSRFASRNCARKEIALAELTSQTSKTFKLARSLYAVSEHCYLEFGSQGNDCLEQRVILLTWFRGVDECLVNLDESLDAVKVTELGQ
jgi:hypothetical protein